jgi:hypothetical protein
LVEADGIPEGCLLSVRAGATRRQAAIEIDKPCQLSFPKNIAHGSPLKVDLLAVLGSCSIETKALCDTYSCDVKSNYGGSDMQIKLRVKEDMDAVYNAHAKNLRSSSCPPNNPESMDENFPNSSYILNVQSPAVVGAHAYLDSHGLLTWLHDVLQILIRDRPDDPWSYIDRSTYKAKSLSLNASAKKTSSVDTVSHAGVIAGDVVSSTVILRPATPVSAAENIMQQEPACDQFVNQEWQSKASSGTRCSPQNQAVYVPLQHLEKVPDEKPAVSMGADCLHDEASTAGNNTCVDDNGKGNARTAALHSDVEKRADFKLSNVAADLSEIRDSSSRLQWNHKASVGTWCHYRPLHIDGRDSVSFEAVGLSTSCALVSTQMPKTTTSRVALAESARTPKTYSTLEDRSCHVQGNPWQNRPSVATWCRSLRIRSTSVPATTRLDSISREREDVADDLAKNGCLHSSRGGQRNQIDAPARSSSVPAAHRLTTANSTSLPSISMLRDTIQGAVQGVFGTEVKSAVDELKAELEKQDLKTAALQDQMADLQKVFAHLQDTRLPPLNGNNAKPALVGAFAVDPSKLDRQSLLDGKGQLLNSKYQSQNERLRRENARLKRLRDTRDAGHKLRSENEQLRSQLGKLRTVKYSEPSHNHRY